MKPSPSPGSPSFVFGSFRLDAGARTLERNGVLVPLLPKPFDALLVLVQNSGRLLDKEFLLSEIWPDAHVDENNLARAISDIRKALGEGPKDHHYVVTVARRGYRFAARVETVDPVAPPLSVSVNADALAGVDATHQPLVQVDHATTALPALGGANGPRPSWLWMGVGAAAVFLVVVAGRAYWSHPGPALGPKDVVLLADFINRTEEPVFDGTLRAALAVQLERSPFLKVMDDAQVRQRLRLMGRSPDQHITNELAREVCVREREKAFIQGSIASLGSSYAIQLQATTCATGETLAREQVEAPDKSRVLASLAVAAETMRAKLGESLPSIQDAERHPITEVTTPSLEAFQAFARGTEFFRRGQWLDAVPFLRRATELDQSFAMAFHQLGTAYGNAGERDLAVEYSRQAFSRIDHVGERERLAISVTYHMRATGDVVKAGEALQLFVQTFPRATIPRSWRGEYYMSLGEFEKAAADYEELVRLDARSRIGYMNLMWAYATLGRFDAVRAVADTAYGLGLDMPEFHHILLDVALIQGVDPDAAREIKWFEGRSDEHLSLESQAIQAIVVGKRRKAAELLIRAADLAQRAGLSGLAERRREASRSNAYGDCQDDSGDFLRACADISTELRNAETRLKARPADVILAAVRVPTRRASVELRRNQPARALALLQAASPFERRYPEVSYVRGLALLQMKQYDESRHEFQKLVDHRGAAWGARYPLAILGTARAASLAGDIATARKSYLSFLELWKEADPDLELLAEAKKEFAALRDP